MWRFGFLLFVLVVYLQCSIAESLQIRSHFRGSNETFSLGLVSQSERKNCIVTVYGGRVPHDLGEGSSRRIRLVSFLKSQRNTRLVSYPDVSQESPRTSIYLKAEESCNDVRIGSRSIAVKLPVSEGGKGSVLRELRRSFLRSQTEIAQAFSDSTFTLPVDIQSSPKSKDRVYVVEQVGRIWKIGSKGASMFLDLTDRVLTGRERGLLGLALSPNFAKDGRFYVNYTRKDDGATVIARFNVSLGEASIGTTEEKLLIVPQPYANHNGGGLAFGEDGYLYIALGDGGSRGDPHGNGQNLGVLLGKILRIDVSGESSYRIPPSNPFSRLTDGLRREIFAYGMRNPWRISFDGKTLWAGDVGQSTKEEIDIIVRGGNYGWNIKEGRECFAVNPCSEPKTIPPIYEYDRSLGASVTGGYVIRDPKSPNLDGVYVYADYVSGRIFALELIENEWVNTELANTDHFVSTFGRGPKSETYFASYLTGKLFIIKQAN